MAKTFATVKLLFAATKRKLIERPFMASPRRRCCLQRRRESYLNTSPRFAIKKMLFAATKRFAMAKTVVHRNKEKTYVSILVLS